MQYLLTQTELDALRNNDRLHAAVNAYENVLQKELAPFVTSLFKHDPALFNENVLRLRKIMQHAFDSAHAALDISPPAS